MDGTTDLALAARSIDELVAACRAGARPEFLHFWGHTTHGIEPGPHVLSQWYPATFEDEAGLRFRSAEHYMMWRKAVLFDDPSTADAIQAAATPEEAKSLGRAVSGFESDRWVEHRWAIVVEGSRLKFGADPALASYLLGTQGKVLVEASPVDAIWGIGISAQSGHADHPTQWRGLNLLGFALMEARELLAHT